MATLEDQAQEIAIAIGARAQAAGMMVSDSTNPSMSELTREARRLDVDLCSLFAAADTAVRC